MKTGEFQYSFGTLSLPGPIPVQVTLTYGNQKSYEAYYGHNWTINYDMKISVSGDQSTITLYDSKMFIFTYEKVSSSPDTYTMDGNPHNYIVETTSNNYDLVYDNGVSCHFYDTTSYWTSLRGTLSWIKDEQDNQVSFTRDTRGRITTITDCFGRETTLSYDASSPYYLEDITDFEDRTWSFFYDGDTDDLLSITYPATDDYPSGLSYDMDYDNYHNLTYIYDPNDDQMVRTYYTYDATDEVYKADKQDRAGGQHEISYDASNNVADVNDRESHVSKIYYTDEGLVSKRVVYTDDPSDDPNSFTTEYIYNNTQQNTRIIYPEGNCTDFTFNSDGFTTGIYRKTSPSDPNNADDPNVIATLYTYVDSSDPLLYSKIDTETDPGGNVTDYDYNNDGLLIKKTLPDVNTPSGSFSTVYEYTYYDSGDPNTMEDPNGVITKNVYYDTSSSDPNDGLLWKVIVDYGQGQDYLNLTTEYAYDDLQRVRKVTDPNGAVTTFVYNALNQLTEVVNALGYKTKFSYDYNGNRKKIERETSDTSNPWQTTELTYNTWSKLTKVKDALGNETTYGYDNEERRTSVTNALSEQTSYTYDERGLLTKVTDPNTGETTFTYDDNGNRLTVTDPNGMTTAYTYDGFDRVIKITDAEGHYRTKEYDKNRRVIKEIAYDDGDTALMQSRYAYNAAGDLIQYAVMADAAATAAVDPNDDRVTEYAYGWANGPMLEETVYYGGTATTDATAAITYHDYDTAGRRITTEDPDGNTTDYWYDENGRVTRIQKIDTSTADASDVITMTTDFIYDDLGQLIKRIEKPSNPDASSDTSWQTTEYEYDKLGNRTKEIRPNDVEVEFEYDLLGRKTLMAVNPADVNQVTEYGYDALGRQIWIVGSTDDTDVDTEQVTNYTYDDLGRVTKITYPDDATIEYAYNPAGKVISRSDQRGIVTYYEYDDTYNMVEKEVTVDTVTTTESFTYDGLGRMLTAKKVEGAATISDSAFAYNDIGRITDANETYFTLAKKEIDYAYDNAGNRIQTVYPNAIQVNRTHAWDGRIDTLKRNSTATIEYDYVGSRTAKRKSGSYVYYEPEYDNLGRMTRAYTYETYGTTSTIAEFDYTYVTDEKNIHKKTFDHRDDDPYNEYTYDDLDRLTVATYIDDANEVFTMDDLGNRTNVNLRSGTNKVYDVNDLTNRYNSVASNNCTYDAAGNLTVDPNGYQYTYDYENRIVKIEDSLDNDVAEYAYDALGRRIKKTDSIASDTTYYYYNDQWQVLAEYDSTNALKYNYAYGNYIDEVLVRFTADAASGPGVKFYAHDHLCSLVALLSSSGGVLERYEYDAYGTARIFRKGTDGVWFTADDTETDSSFYGNPYTFTGRRLDVLDSGDLKIMYYRNRYYSSEIGRFMTQDPLGTNDQRAVIMQDFLFEWASFLQKNEHLFIRELENYEIYRLLSEIVKLNQESRNIFRPELFRIYENNLYNRLLDARLFGETNYSQEQINLYDYVKSNPLINMDPQGLGLLGCLKDYMKENGKSLAWEETILWLSCVGGCGGVTGGCGLAPCLYGCTAAVFGGATAGAVISCLIGL